MKTQFLEVNPVLPVRDMKASLAFYEEKLGFTRTFDDATQPGDTIDYAGLCRGGLCLHLQSLSPDEADPTMPLIRIRVQNIEPLYEEYKAQDVISSGGHLEPKPWGSKDFGLYTPDGAALVFYEDL